MEPDAIMLKGATVTARASKVTLKADTFMYNASAFRTPEGSVVEELVKRLPGAEVDDNGTIKINGKEVKKILVDGKEFMTGDTKTALQNLPTNIIDRIKAYDQQSDLARVSGIQDGEEETVLDFGIKPGMNKGLMANIDLGIGTHSRYFGRGMGAVMKDNLKVMLFTRANNVNDMGFPGGGGGGRWGQQRQGLNERALEPLRRRPAAPCLQRADLRCHHLCLLQQHHTWLLTLQQLECPDAHRVATRLHDQHPVPTHVALQLQRRT